MKGTELIHDSKSDKFIVQGNFLDIDKPNQDGLAFSRTTMEWLVNDERYKKYMNMLFLNQFQIHIS